MSTLLSGFKGFNSDMTCRGFQFEVGKEYAQDDDLIVGSIGFHFCFKAPDVLNYYDLRKDHTMRVCEILASGNIDIGDDKCATNKIKIVREIPREEFLRNYCTGKFIFPKNHKYEYAYFKDGYLHGSSESEPTILLKDGTKEWYKNGILDRDNDLPAIECTYGLKKWYKNGQLHIIESSDGSKFWYKDGERHRGGDFPAVELYNGTKEWYREGKYHRDGDLPAVVYADGTKEWYINDIQYFPTIN